MTKKLDPNTRNNDIGLYFTKTRRVVVDQDFGELATWIKAGTAGDVIWYNSFSDETSIINLEAGEPAPIAATKILSAATIDGTPETTTATTLFWMTTASDIAS